MSEEKNFEEMYHALNRLHTATNQAVVDLQKENSKLKDEIILLNAKLMNCQQALDINKEIMRNALARQNELAATYGDEIRLLKQKLKAKGEVL